MLLYQRQLYQAFAAGDFEQIASLYVSPWNGEEQDHLHVTVLSVTWMVQAGRVEH